MSCRGRIGPVLVLSFLLSFLVSSMAVAEREYVDRIPNGGVSDCDNCHGKNDSFHDDWERKGGWGRKLAGIDSDGDGFTNGEELQDPEGSWRPGQSDPGTRSLVSDPSDRGSLPSVAGAQSKKQRRCISKLNDSHARIAEAASVAALDCLALAMAEELASSVDVCLAAVSSTRKVAKRAAEAEAVAQSRCLEKVPDFGPVESAPVVAGAVEERLAMVGDLFGPDPESALFTDAVDPDGARCQRSVAKVARRCADLGVEEFNACKNRGLKRRQIGSSADLAACLDLDPAGSFEKRCGPAGSKLAKAVARRCGEAAVDLATAFPGCEAGSEVALVECASERVRCRICRELVTADGLERDCDLFDDTVANASCSD